MYNFKQGQVVTVRYMSGIKRDGYILETGDKTCKVQLNLNVQVFFIHEILPYECSEPSLKDAMEYQMVKFEEKQAEEKTVSVAKFADNLGQALCLTPQKKERTKAEKKAVIIGNKRYSRVVKNDYVIVGGHKIQVSEVYLRQAEEYFHVDRTWKDENKDQDYIDL